MLSRLMLAIVLLSSHTLALRAAHGAQTHEPQRVVEFEPCCPLCMPTDDGAQMGCGCGCGELQQDDRVPSSPDGPTAIVSTQLAIPAPRSLSIRTIACVATADSRSASINDDASGHSNTNRFLARVGVWLN